MMEAKTLEEMQKIAKEVFGEEAEVYYADNQWVVSTGVEENFDLEAHKDREAYARYHEWDGGENSLLRWARKNGHGGESLAELFDSYDEEMEASARRTVESVRENIEKGLSFDWEGGAEWRDRVLAYAEEKGW